MQTVTSQAFNQNPTAVKRSANGLLLHSLSSQ